MGTPLPQHGNLTTFNMENVLRSNIVNSEYFRDTCGKLNSCDELIDEIYYSVSDAEPWMSGNARGASSAFCLLYRLFLLQPTEEDLQRMLDHEDSPYIRVVGFLYLRYVVDPKTLWDWIEGYIRDSEEFCPSPEPAKKITMGAYVRDIFLDQYYFETIFPRIPKPVQDSFVKRFAELGLPTKPVGNAGQGGPDRRGVDEGNRRPASVKASLSVAFGQRAPNRSGVREEGRGLGAGMKGGVGERREPHNGSDRSPAAYGRDRDTATRKDRDNEDRKDRDRERERSRDRDRDRDRDRKRGRDDDRYYSKDRNRDRDADRYRDGDRNGERYRDRSREPYRSQHRDSHSGRDRYKGGGRDTRDVFKENVGRADYEKLKERYL
eukprot:jgi/Botrbrau1/10001/Bobra.0012s0090.1